VLPDTEGGFDDDPLTDTSPPGVLWSRVNFVEAAPGVLVPANWSFYGRVMEIAGRRGFADLGVIPRSAIGYPAAISDRMFGIFHGYAAINVEVIRSIMGGLPGTNGDDVERDMLGSVREGVVDEGFGWRAPAVLAKAPGALLQLRRGPAGVRRAAGRWWSERVDTAGLRPGVDARTALREASDRFGAAIRWQARGRLFLQGSASVLARYAERIGEPHLAGLLMTGTGVEETEVADDLWLLAAGRLDLPVFLARHGFHGPNSGNVDATSWREDPSPVERLLPTLREAQSPSARRAALGPARDAAVATLLGRLPRRDRIGARAALRLGPTAAASLERTKATMLISMDVGRAAIRAIGAELAAAGLLDDPEDAFQFFVDELCAPGRADLRDRARRRKAARERYLGVEVPATWTGQPEATPKRAAGRAPVTRVTGLGVGTGSVEGPVRVVLDPADDIDVEYGDILVCPTTDPSWVALMTVAGGLVIDIGGSVSHGAVVAREMGLPCVIGTRTGTVELRDGDLVRVDGATGVVEVLKPASA
jgi:pyruvate,water dikinase